MVNVSAFQTITNYNWLITCIQLNPKTIIEWYKINSKNLDLNISNAIFWIRNNIKIESTALIWLRLQPNIST